MTVKKMYGSDSLTRLGEIQFIPVLNPEEAGMCIDSVTASLRHSMRLCDEMRKRVHDPATLGNLSYLSQRLAMLSSVSEQLSMEVVGRHIVFGGDGGE